VRDGKLDAVLLYSPRGGENFSRCVQHAGLAEMCRALIAVCISEAAAKKIEAMPLREIRVAVRPSEDAMFEALQR
jgi:uroporphyrinogen-III synthase